MKKIIVIITIVLFLGAFHMMRAYSAAEEMLGAYWGSYSEFSDVNFLLEDFNSDKWNYLKVQANRKHPDLIEMQGDFKRCFWDSMKFGDCMPEEY